MNIFKHKYFKFGLVTTIYLLWVIWMGNYWFLFGLPVIFDMYVTKKVNWTFWKKREGKNSAWVEWLDALIFAVVAVTIINIFLFQNYKIPTGSMEKSLLIGDHLYVSKVAYGPKLPNTPLSFPFAQNTLPLTTTKSYLEWINLPYKRLAGFRKVERNDVVVFNFPAGDTVVVENSAQSFQGNVLGVVMMLQNRDRQNNTPLKSDEEYKKEAVKYLYDNYTIIIRPVDRRDNYIKRCIAIPGDTLKVIGGDLYVNGKLEQKYPGQQLNYVVATSGQPINPKVFEKLNIAKDDIDMNGSMYLLPLSEDNSNILKSYNNITSVTKNLHQPGVFDEFIFPHNPNYTWNVDYFGPLGVPKKGQTVPLNLKNLPLFERIITAYEGNTLSVKDSVIYINDKPADSYTFQMDYYFMMGDSRHNSADSRYWGFVPEDHIVGRPVFIWLSLDKDKKFLSKIRWNRMFSVVR